PRWSLNGSSAAGRNSPPSRELARLLKIERIVDLAPLGAVDREGAHFGRLGELADGRWEPLLEAVRIAHRILERRDISRDSIGAKYIEPDRLGIDGFDWQGLAYLGQPATIRHHLHVIGII